MSHLPLSFCENDGFLQFVKKVIPLWKPPSRGNMTRQMDTKYNRVLSYVKKEIAALPSVSLTFDTWTEEHTHTSYLGGTLHFLNQFDIESFNMSIFELDDSHTSEYLQKKIEEACQVFAVDPEKVSVVVTDNAANITGAVKAFFPGKTIPCFDHTLNLVPKYALGLDNQKEERVPGVPELISKVKKIVTFVNHSQKASDLLKKKQIEDDKKTEGTVLKLIQDNITRWSSTYYMLTRYIELSPHLALILMNFENVEILNGSELKTLRLISQLLKPFEAATKEMSGEHATTMSKVIPMANLIIEVKFIHILTCINSLFIWVFSN